MYDVQNLLQSVLATATGWPEGRNTGMCGVILSVMPNTEKLTMEIRDVEVSKEPLELYKILKFECMVSSGGEAKSVISEGQVLVNGKVETRKRKQIVSGDIVEFGEDKIRIQLK